MDSNPNPNSVTKTPVMPLEPPCGSASFFSEHRNFQIADEHSEKVTKELERIADCLGAGTCLLLDAGNDFYIALGHSFLCLQVVMDERLAKFQGDVKKLAISEHPTYELSVEDATGLLLDYADFWIRSFSMVLETLDDLRDRVIASGLKGTGEAQDTNSSTSYTEVMLFVHADHVIDDKGIRDSEQLQAFLEELSQQKIQRVHMACSAVAVKQKDAEYSHLII